ncbi:excalibur calcium-binding domain-containing protein [Thiolapillus sp.]
MKQIVFIAIISIAVIAGYNRYQSNKMMSELQQEMDSAVAIPTTTPLHRSINKNDRLAYSCDGRVYCSEMNSCEEATFFLNNCPHTKMDGDHDGIPCERQWCSR